MVKKNRLKKINLCRMLEQGKALGNECIALGKKAGRTTVDFHPIQ